MTTSELYDDLSYHEDYWLGYKYACGHDWELHHMFTSSYERCKKCGEERDCP